MKPEGWEVVFVAPGLAYANIAAGRLEAEGIPVRMDYESVAVLYGLTLDGLGRVNLLVPAGELEHARRVLDETYREDDLEWENPSEK
ncbi:MAG TPA: hypothetical protein ENN35_04790 [Deltaproteobacteria bacterium]|nr:hypothetical protein [Deltaproteobacteria bacterium]